MEKIDTNDKCKPTVFGLIRLISQIADDYCVLHAESREFLWLRKKIIDEGVYSDTKKLVTELKKAFDIRGSRLSWEGLRGELMALEESFLETRLLKHNNIEELFEKLITFSDKLDNNIQEIKEVFCAPDISDEEMAERDRIENELHSIREHYRGRVEFRAGYVDYAD